MYIDVSEVIRRQWYKKAASGIGFDVKYKSDMSISVVVYGSALDVNLVSYKLNQQGRC